MMKSELLQQALHSNPKLQRLNSVTDSVFTGFKLPGLSSTHRQKAASAAQTACVKIMEGRGAHTSSGHRHSGQMAADHLWQPQCRRVEAVITPDCCLWCQTHMLTCHIWLDCRDVSSVMFNKILFLHTLGHEDVPKSTFGQKNKQFYYQLNYSVLSPQPLICYFMCQDMAVSFQIEQFVKQPLFLSYYTFTYTSQNYGGHRRALYILYPFSSHYNFIILS